MAPMAKEITGNQNPSTKAASRTTVLTLLLTIEAREPLRTQAARGVCVYVCMCVLGRMARRATDDTRQRTIHTRTDEPSGQDEDGIAQDRPAPSLFVVPELPHSLLFPVTWGSVTWERKRRWKLVSELVEPIT